MMSPAGEFMEITYLGHSAFRLKGKTGTVVTDPFLASVGFKLPAVKADVVTISHAHDDHNAVAAVEGTTTHPRPYLINQAGEYEVGGITVFGYPTWHDAEEGKQRGRNIIYSIFVDDIHVLHLGDLGHELAHDLIENMPDVDVLLCPVGGEFTLGVGAAIDVIHDVEPGVVIPMHYRTDQHSDTFAKLATVEEFMKQWGKQVEPQDNYVVNAHGTDDEVETKLVVLRPKA
jgi:L-ascorbate metabolism protein UlaG (beta-lactamase superfamily)